MLTGFQIWDDKIDKPAGYASVKHNKHGDVLNIEIINCTISNSNPEAWVSIACQVCNSNAIEIPIAGVVFYHEDRTVSVRQCTPF